MPHFTKPQLLKLQEQLKTDDAIGRKFGITRQAIHQWRIRLGIGFKKNRNKERDDSIAALYKKGTAGPAVAKKIGLSVAQVYRVLRKKGALK